MYITYPGMYARFDHSLMHGLCGCELASSFLIIEELETWEDHLFVKLLPNMNLLGFSIGVS